jgi:hypothetical protein
MTRFCIGRIHARELRAIATALGAGAPDLAAIDRLARFEGTDQDVIRACNLYREHGEPANAEDLRRGCFGEQIERRELAAGSDASLTPAVTVSPAAVGDASLAPGGDAPSPEVLDDLSPGAPSDGGVIRRDRP